MEDLETRKLSDYRLEDYAAMLLFWLMALDVFAQFFSRYVIGSSISWTEEAARYLLVAVTFIGAPMAARHSQHIAVDIVSRHVSGILYRLIYCFTKALEIVFLLTLCWLCYQVAQKTVGRMVGMPLPKNLIYYVALAGLAGTAIRSALAFSPSNPASDHHEGGLSNAD